MIPDSSAPIFIHSLWRAGSTYLFQVFRRSEAGYYCYQEPLHEITLFNKDTPEKLLEYSDDLIRILRHPELTQPYYQELYDIHRFWKDQITKSDIYDTYFSSECSETLCSFFKALIEHAQGRAVIQECRTSNRIGALKNSFGGIHCYLFRNPWDQWWSYKVADYFDIVQMLTVNALDPPSSIKSLQQIVHFKEFHSNRLQDELEYFNTFRLSAEDSYFCFYMLWCLSYLEAHKHADLIINIDKLSLSGNYRNKILRMLEKSGIAGLDLSDCQTHFTHFTLQDADFFKPIEDKVYGGLLSHNVTLTQIDLIREVRQKYMPELQKNLPEKTIFSSALEDAKRAREIVRLRETAFSWQIADQINLRHKLEKKHSIELNLQLQRAEQQCYALTETLERARGEAQEQANKLNAQLQAEQLGRNTLEQQLVAAKQECDTFAEQKKRLDAELASYVEQMRMLSCELMRIQQSWWCRMIVPLQRLFARQPLPRHAGGALSITPLPAVQTGQSYFQEATTIMNNIETLDDVLRLYGSDFLRAAYKVVLGREPDNTGMNYYLGRLQAGYGKRSVLAQIACSLERARRDEWLLAIQDDRAFVTAAYQAILKRAPEPEGFQHHVNALAQGYERRQMLKDIDSSEEAKVLAVSRSQFEKELLALVEEESRARHWFWRWFGRYARLERQINRLEFAIGQSAQTVVQTQSYLNRLTARLELLLSETGAVPRALTQSEKPNVVESNLSHLSPRARQIYTRLAQAIATRSTEVQP